MRLRVLLAATSAAVCLATVQVNAAPVTSDVAVSAKAASSAIEQVQWRGRGWGGRGWAGRGWRGPGPWLGFGAAVAAGVVIADLAYLPRRGYYYDTYDYVGPYYYPAEYRGDPRDLCAKYFKSFEWRTGMYTTYGGERRMCPYLREY